MTERFEVRVAQNVVQQAVAQLQRALQGGEGGIDHAQHGVAARQVVPGDRPLRLQADDPTIALQGPRVVTAGGQIVGVDPQRIGVKRVTFQETAEKLQLEVALGLLTQALVDVSGPGLS